MATSRTYGQSCAAAHALDLVGERWALLIVRELLLGPKRFTDLRSGLAHASANVLAERLRELETHGVVRRRKLGPPARTWVYELTEWGKELEPVIIALGRWGVRSPFRPQAEAGSDSIVLALKALFDPDAAKGLAATFEVRFGDEPFIVQVARGRIELDRGDAEAPDATIETDPSTFGALITGSADLADAIKAGTVQLSGDGKMFSRFLDAIRLPEPVGADATR